MSEDCLTINVIRSAMLEPLEKKIPVLVWFYGGGFESGETMSNNATRLAIQSVQRVRPH